MKQIKAVYFFLGSLYFAIFLMVAAALMVAIGTAIESVTGSHLLAAKWSYDHPLFLLLLCLFFVNILFSALQRWPFKKRHFPFLMTHLGLLMILGGTILKNQVGLQGYLQLLEGSSSHEVLLPYSDGLLIEKPAKKEIVSFDPQNPLKTYQAKNFSELTIQPIAYFPHVEERLESWIKGDYFFIKGQKPLAVSNWQNGQPLPAGTQMHFASYPYPWQVVAIKTSDATELIEKFYLHQLNLVITSSVDSRVLLELPLQTALRSSLDIDGSCYLLRLFLPYFFKEQTIAPSLTAYQLLKEKRQEKKLQILLQGKHALFNQKQEKDDKNQAQFHLDLKRPLPMLLAIQEETNATELLFFDQYGRIEHEQFSTQNIETFYAYDGGYGGYAIQTTLPFPPFATGRQDKERALTRQMEQEINLALQKGAPLSPPLEVFKKTCKKANLDFAQTFILYLQQWKKNGQILFENPQDPALTLFFKNLYWKEEELKVQKACQWVYLLYQRFHNLLKEKKELRSYLKKQRWPFTIDSFNSPTNFFMQLAEQTFFIADKLPECPIEVATLKEKNSLLSAFFLAYKIDPQLLFPSLEQISCESDYALFERWQPIEIETTLKSRLVQLYPPLKIEERQPGIIIEVCKGTQKELIALAYHPTGLKWPIFQGRYKLRYQPQAIKIPYSIQLKQAREICYPGTTQTYSYEADIGMKKKDKKRLKTLSMNSVHETWDGYRFYLSAISKPSLHALKSAQIIVNRDPAKYFLTYPGIFLVFMGTILLFWFKR